MAASSGRILFIEGSRWLGCAFTVRALAQEGHRVEILAHRRSFIWKTRFAARRHLLPPNPSDIADCLRQLLARERYDRIIIGDEATLQLLANETDLNYPQPIFPVPANPETLNRAILKTKFLEACQNAGVPVPKTRIVHEGGELARAVEDLGYPVIFKPDGKVGGEGVCLLRCQADTEEIQKALPETFSAVLQQYMTGREGSCSVIYRQGRVIAWMAAYRPLVFPEPYGQACVKQLMNHPALPALLKGVGEVTQFDGIAGLQWVEDPMTGCPNVFEFAPRPHPDFALFRRAGIDLTEAWRRLQSPDDPTEPPLTPVQFEKDPIWLFPSYPIRCLVHKECGSLPGLRWNNTLFPGDDLFFLLACVKHILREWWRRRRA